MTTTAPATSQSSSRAHAGIDPRGPQFTAGITAVVLVVVLLLPSPWAAVLTGVQAVLFGIGATRGVQHTPHAWLFRTVVRPRLAPPEELEDPAPAAVRPGRRAGLRARRRSSASPPALTLLGQVAIGFALVAALLNAVFRLLPGLRAVPADQARRRLRRALCARLDTPASNIEQPNKREPTMTRESSLVSAQWVEENLDNPDIVLVEVDEDTTAYDKGHIKGAIKLDWTTDLQDQVRRDFVSKAAVRGAAVRRAASATTTPSCSTAATTTGSRPTPTGTSSSTATRT